VELTTTNIMKSKTHYVTVRSSFVMLTINQHITTSLNSSNIIDCARMKIVESVVMTLVIVR